jgi:hypothetical protein
MTRQSPKIRSEGSQDRKCGVELEAVSEEDEAVSEADVVAADEADGDFRQDIADINYLLVIGYKNSRVY